MTFISPYLISVKLLLLLMEQSGRVISEDFKFRMLDKYEIMDTWPKIVNPEMITQVQVYRPFDCDILCTRTTDCFATTFNWENKECTMAVRAKMVQVQKANSSLTKVLGTFFLVKNCRKVLVEYFNIFNKLSISLFVFL